jgi:WD40 repeat protein
MKRFIFRVMVALWLILSGLILLSRLPRAHSTAPLLMGLSGYSRLLLNVIDPATHVNARVELPWLNPIIADHRCLLVGVRTDAAAGSVATLHLDRLPYARTLVTDAPLPVWDDVYPVLSPDRQTLGLLSPRNDPRSLTVLDLLTGQVTPILENVTHIPSIWWLTPERFLYAGARDRYVIYDLAARTQQPSAITGSSSRISVNATVLTTLEYGDYRLYDRNSGLERARYTLPDHINQPLSMSLLPDLTHLVYNSYDLMAQQDRVSVYNLRTGEEIELAVLNMELQPSSFSSDVMKLAYLEYPTVPGDIVVLATLTGELLHRIPAVDVRGISWSPDSRYLVIRGSDLRLFDTHTGQILPWTEFDVSMTHRLFWSSDNRTLYVQLKHIASSSFDLVASTIENGQFLPPVIYRWVPENIGICDRG